MVLNTSCVFGWPIKLAGDKKKSPEQTHTEKNLFKKSVGNTDIYWRSGRSCSRCRADDGGWCYQGWSSPAGTSGRRLVSSARWGLIPAAGASERSDSGWSLENENWSEICIIGGPDVCRHVNSFWWWFSGPEWGGRWRWYSPVTWATTAWEIRLFARKDLISSLITELSRLQAEWRMTAQNNTCSHLWWHYQHILYSTRKLSLQPH